MPGTVEGLWRKRAEIVTRLEAATNSLYGRFMRPPRIQAADAIYHIACRGNRKQPIVRDDVDRRRFLKIAGHVITRRKWICFAYCLMTNHYHLLVQTPEPDIAIGMHAINSQAARTFNKRHGYEGHLFERRYGSELVLGDSHLLEAVRYIVRNPVRAGLCDVPEDWRWSSYRATVGVANPPEWLNVNACLRLFSPGRERAQRAFRDFVIGRFGIAEAA